MSNRPKRRRGFTLIEIMMVLTIIVILIALLLPAVQQAREAARRTQCKNNLMQIGTALFNYQHSFDCLPPGTVNPTGPIVNEPSGYHMGWLVQTAPLLEQAQLYQNADMSAGVYSATNSMLLTTRIPGLVCPSDQPNPDSIVAPTSYVGCTGGENVAIDVDNGGLLFLNSSISDREVRDGMSQTILAGERLLEDLSGPELGWGSGTSSSLRHSARAINANPLRLRAGGPNSPVPGYMPPPDGPDAGEPKPAPPPEQQPGGFSSPHTGGAQFLMADGAVKFLSENIVPQVFSNLGNREDGQIVGSF